MKQETKKLLKDCDDILFEACDRFPGELILPRKIQRLRERIKQCLKSKK